MLTGKKHTAEDGLLLAELSTGSRVAFNALYEKYWAQVLDEAYRRLSDMDQAKDVAQEVFSFMWTRGTRTPIDNLPAWLYTVVKNQVYKQMKTQNYFVPLATVMTELEEFSEDADAHILQQELVLAYQNLIDSLPEQQRIIFKMRFQDHLSPEQIAEILNISPKTVRNHLGRAITRLKAAFLLVQIIFFFSAK